MKGSAFHYSIIRSQIGRDEALPKKRGGGQRKGKMDTIFFVAVQTPIPKEGKGTVKGLWKGSQNLYSYEKRKKSAADSRRGKVKEMKNYPAQGSLSRPSSK